MVTTTRKRLAWLGVAAASIGALVLKTYPHLRQEIINWLEGVPQPSEDEDEVKDDTRPSTPTREKIILLSATVERIVREKPEHPVLAPTAVDVPASSRQVLLRQVSSILYCLLGRKSTNFYAEDVAQYGDHRHHNPVGGPLAAVPRVLAVAPPHEHLPVLSPGPHHFDRVGTVLVTTS